MDLIVRFFFCITTLSAYWALLCAWSYQPGREDSNQHQLDWAEALWISLVALTIYTGWISVILASLNRFSLINLIIGQALLCLVLGVKFKNLRRPRFKASSTYEIALGLLLVFCSLVYFRPHEYVLGGTDAGGYINMGFTISKTGQFSPEREWYKVLNDFRSVTLRQEAPPTPGFTQMPYVGWHINPNNPVRLIPQFFPFHPVLLALGISLFGLYGAFYVTPLWGLLGVATIYFFGRKLVNPALGLIGAFLFALTPIQLYFSRYPTAESLTLVLIFTGLTAYQHLVDSKTESIGWGLMGGASLGAALLTRIDLPLLILLTLTTLVIMRFRGAWAKGWSALTLTFLFFLAHFLVHAFYFSKSYMATTYLAGLNGVIKPLLLHPAFLLFGALIAFFSLLTLSGKMVWITKIFSETKIRWLLIGGALGLSIYAYFIRPSIETITWSISYPSGNRFPIMNGENWVRIGWYLTPLGLILATAGFMLITYRESLARWGFYLTLGTLTTVQYTYNIMNTPYHIYAMRRYLPIVIPTLIIFSAYSILVPWQKKNHPWNRIIGVGLLICLAGGLTYQSRNFFFHQDFPTLVEQMKSFDRRLKEGAIIIIAESDEFIFGDRLAPPLQEIFGHNVATIRRDGPRLEPFLKRLLATAKSQNRPVQLIATEPIVAGVRNLLTLKPVGIFPLTLITLQNTFFEYPSRKETLVYPIQIYDVTSITSNALEFFTDQMIDIGEYDAPFIREGFYGKENIPNFPSSRWVSGEAMIDIPIYRKGGSQIFIRAMTFRPPNSTGNSVQVYLDGKFLGNFVPQQDWKVFPFNTNSFPKDTVSSLQFKTAPFIPAELKIGNDSRKLGFLLDWIKIK